MLAPLPDHIDVLRLAKQGSKLVGKQSLEKMSRLRQGILLQDDIVITSQKHVLEEGQKEHRDIGVADVELEFGEDNERIPFIKGRAQANVYITCQRCLEPMLLELDASFLLGAVEDEAKASQLPEQYEPLMISGRSSSLTEIIEDELILSVPLVALHKVDQCSASELLLAMASDAARENEKEQGNGKERGKVNNPFSVLSSLKKK